MNRNQFFMIGVVVLLLGVQFRLVDTVVLNEPTTRFLAKRLKKRSATATAPLDMPAAIYQTAGSPLPVKKEIAPPPWLGWALLSIGGVLILHSLAMPKPG